MKRLKKQCWTSRTVWRPGFELASVSGELVKKFSKRTRLIEQLARERYTVLEAEAQDLVKKTGMDFADAFAQVKGKLGADSREAKSLASLAPEEQLANWRAQMTPEERASLKVESVKGTASQNLLEGRERQMHQKWLLAKFRRYRESDSEPLETFVRAFEIPVITLNHLRRVPAFRCSLVGYSR